MPVLTPLRRCSAECSSRPSVTMAYLPAAELVTGI